MKEQSAEKRGSSCWFCRKAHREVGVLVEGPGPVGNGGVYICRDCAKFALAVFDQMEEERRSGIAPAGEPR